MSKGEKILIGVIVINVIAVLIVGELVIKAIPIFIGGKLLGF